MYIVCIIPPSSPFRSPVPLKGELLGDVADTPQFWGSFDQCSWFEVPFHLGMVGIYGFIVRPSSLPSTPQIHITTPSHHHLDNQLNTISQPPLKPNTPTIHSSPPTTLTSTLTQIHLITPTPQWQTNGPQKGSSPVYSCTLPSS